MNKKELIILVAGIALAALLCVVFVWKPWQNDNKNPVTGDNGGTSQSTPDETGENGDATADPTAGSTAGDENEDPTDTTGEQSGTGSQGNEGSGSKNPEKETEPVPPVENVTDPEATEEKVDNDFDVVVDNTPGKIEGGSIDFDDLLPPDMKNDA